MEVASAQVHLVLPEDPSRYLSCLASKGTFQSRLTTFVDRWPPNAGVPCRFAASGGF